ncbi:reverse transcriptase domain-containing protein [Tanacetum coccineum]
MVSNQIDLPGFPPIQNIKIVSIKIKEVKYQPKSRNQFQSKRGSNFNQGQVYQPPTNQPPVYQAPTPQMQVQKVTIALVPTSERNKKSIFIEIPKPKAKKTIQEPNSLKPTSYQPKLPYPKRMKVREKDTPSAKQSSNLVGALKPTRMTLELANCSVTHPMGIAEDVVVRVDGFTFLADFVVVNFEPDPRVPIILGRPFLRTAKALI